MKIALIPECFTNLCRLTLLTSYNNTSTHWITQIVIKAYRVCPNLLISTEHIEIIEIIVHIMFFSNVPSNSDIKLQK